MHIGVHESSIISGKIVNGPILKTENMLMKMKLQNSNQNNLDQIVNRVYSALNNLHKSNQSVVPPANSKSNINNKIELGTFNN